ncbi:MAG: NAD(P)/FAD-dependent oxidoreductase [Acidobacteriota bacterium]|nr:NAD(P)/FAD-dependent oxidoreductase [Acidobacteriota bacterium]
METDITIVGAGPAGSTAATLLAGMGFEVALLDRAVFPRHKTCASWINRLAFIRFPYLNSRLDDLVECPFYGVTFYDSSLARQGRYLERAPAGYLSLRSKFDDGLRRIAVEAGASFYGGSHVVNVEQSGGEVRARTATGDEFRSRILIGADGVASRVAMCAGLRRAWGPRDCVMCANADIPFDGGKIQEFYGVHFPFRVYLMYRSIPGYGWVFPKRDHVCVGIGGLLADNREIRPLFSNFFQDLQAHNHLPASLRPEDIHFDIDPAGGIYNTGKLTAGRIILIGDAAGFVSGSTGEGIYPGMVSAEAAAAVIHRALTKKDVEAEVLQFNQAWRRELASYLKRLPGGGDEAKTHGRLDLIFRSGLVARLAGRMFLYGENPSMLTAAKSLWAARI